MEETSLSLLDRIRDTSDPKSWDRLVTLYAPLLKRWVMAYEIQESDAEDIVQEVLAVVVRDVSSFEHNERAGAFRSWLRVILVNRVREFWRTRKYRPIATGTSSIDEKLNQLQDDTSEVSHIWNREHDQFVVQRLMKTIRSQFDPKTWQAFRLQVMDGQKSEQVAQKLSMSISSVYMAKSRVLSALRRESEGLVDKF